MSLKAIYEQYLAQPTSQLLAADVALHYVPTTTSFATADGVLKHLRTQRNSVNRKGERILNCIEGRNSLCIDAEIKLEFVTGAGAYLPALDDNFVINHTVTFPMIHMVHFNSQHKISQIRLYWDQGSLLRQINIISSRNRNWPIRDAAEQTRLINSSIAAAAAAAAATSTTAVEPTPHAPAANQTSRSTSTGQHGIPHERQSPSKRQGRRDQNASISLFEPPEVTEADTARSRTSSQPPARDYSDLFGGNESDSTPTKPTFTSKKDSTITTAAARSAEATGHIKSSAVPTGHDEESTEPVTPRAMPKNYNHFEFGEGDATPSRTKLSKSHDHFEFGEAGLPTLSVARETKLSKVLEHFEFGEAAVARAPNQTIFQQHFEIGVEDDESAKHRIAHDASSVTSSRPTSSRQMHTSQWDFEDFATPEKPHPKVRGQDVRHFGWSDDEQESPVKNERVVHPRRDAEIHFKIQDEGTPFPEEKQPRKGAAHNQGLHLYENNLHNESDQPVTETENPGPQRSNLNGTSRKKDFDAHFAIEDQGENPSTKPPGEPKRVASDRQKVVNMMNPTWDAFEDGSGSQGAAAAPPTLAKRTVRDPNLRHWGFGDEGVQ